MPPNSPPRRLFHYQLALADLAVIDAESPMLAQHMAHVGLNADGVELGAGMGLVDAAEGIIEYEVQPIRP